MTVENINQKTKAVYWPYTGRSDEYEEPILGDPVEVNVRWEYGTNTSQLADGTKVSKDATVFTSVDIPTESQMWKGALADLPDPLVDLFVVKDTQKMPDLKSKKFRRTVILTRKR